MNVLPILNGKTTLTVTRLGRHIIINDKAEYPRIREDGTPLQHKDIHIDTSTDTPRVYIWDNAYVPPGWDELPFAAEEFGLKDERDLLNALEPQMHEAITPILEECR